jgi:hypothetical protein
MADEGPSPEDLDRFDRDHAYCPECGAEIWDQAELCPSCGCCVGGRTLGRPPIERWLRNRWLILVAFLAAAAFLAAVIF